MVMKVRLKNVAPCRSSVVRGGLYVQVRTIVGRKHRYLHRCGREIFGAMELLNFAVFDRDPKKITIPRARNTTHMAVS